MGIYVRRRHLFFNTNFQKLITNYQKLFFSVFLRARRLNRTKNGQKRCDVVSRKGIARKEKEEIAPCLPRKKGGGFISSGDYSVSLVKCHKVLFTLHYSLFTSRSDCCSQSSFPC